MSVRDLVKSLRSRFALASLHRLIGACVITELRLGKVETQSVPTRFLWTLNGTTPKGERRFYDPKCQVVVETPMPAICAVLPVWIAN